MRIEMFPSPANREDNFFLVVMDPVSKLEPMPNLSPQSSEPVNAFVSQRVLFTFTELHSVPASSSTLLVVQLIAEPRNSHCFLCQRSISCRLLGSVKHLLHMCKIR